MRINILIWIVGLVLAFSSLASDKHKKQINDANREIANELTEVMVQNEVDSFVMLQGAVEKWFFEGGHQSRVHDFNTSYEIPLDEVKSDGYLPQSAFLRKPGQTSGVDEASNLWHTYMIKVQKVNESSGIVYKVILSLGRKVQSLPPPMLASCHVYAIYRNNGVVSGWNWHKLPSKAGKPLPYVGQKCADVGISELNSVGNYVRSNWASYVPPGPIPNTTVGCLIVPSLPGGVTPPVGAYEDVAVCNFGYIPPITPTYCQANLFLNRLSGSTTTHLISNTASDCSAGALPGFTLLSDAIVGTLVTLATPSICSVVNNHEVRCIASELDDPGGPPVDPPPVGSTECEVFVYDQEGILPPVRTHYWDDRDCTGMYSSTQTILEWLQYDEHYNNVFAMNFDGTDDVTRVHSNEYCEFHLDSSGSLGSQFANDIYWNCDNRDMFDEYISSYNISNPDAQVVNCEQYVGILAPEDIEHKAKCEQVDTTIDVEIRGSDVNSNYRYGHTDQLGGANAIARIYPINHSIYKGMVEEQSEDEPGGRLRIWHESWVILPDGITINELINEGYTYSLNYVLSDADIWCDNNFSQCENPADVQWQCRASLSGNINLMNQTIEFEADAEWYTNGINAFGGVLKCVWDINITEYKNTTATGKKGSFSVIAEVEVIER